MGVMPHGTRGKLLGQKPPLRLNGIWAVRSQLAIPDRRGPGGVDGIYRQARSLRAGQLLRGDAKLESAVR